jgi:hypothetical protein
VTLKTLARLSTEAAGDWEVVEEGGRFLLSSRRWLRGIADAQEARQRARDLLDAIIDGSRTAPTR